MKTSRIRLADLFSSLPPDWPSDILPQQIAEMVRVSGHVVVVLDDDPTGTQTVHDVPVLAEWTTDALASVMREVDVFYISINSRALTEEQARRLNREIAQNLLAASRQEGRPFVVVSRSDSTLRGHYPAEIDALAEVLQADHPFDGHLIAPYFYAGGRFTVHGVHYVAEGEWLVPAAETESARDAVFGYHYSDLPHWVEEKSGGRWRADDVVVLDLVDVRRGGPDWVAQCLLEIEGGRPVVVDAVSDHDLAVVVLGLLQAEAAGKRFLYRTAASFVAVRGAIAPRGLLTAAEMRPLAASALGGLVAIGSYVRRSTEQLDQARQLDNVHEAELRVSKVLNPNGRDKEVQRARRVVDTALAEGKDVLLYTSRELVTGADAASSLDVGNQVSAALVDVVRNLQQQPRFFIAKGGITSIDLVTNALGMRRAQILGQILPGVPVWRLGNETRCPGMAYVVFPGNVGGPEAVAEAILRLRGA